jgi:hypothetical protein
MDKGAAMSDWNRLRCEKCQVESEASINGTTQPLAEVIEAWPAIRLIYGKYWWVEVSIMGNTHQSGEFFQFLEAHYDHGEITIAPAFGQ